MKKELFLTTGLCALLLSLTGCGAKLDNQTFSNNDQLWTMKISGQETGDSALSFSNNGTGKVINLLSGEKESDFTYMIKNNDDSYKLYLTSDPSDTVEIKINSDDIKKDDIVGRVDSDKITFVSHDKDYEKQYKEDKIKEEEKDAKALVDDLKVIGKGTDGNGSISFKDDSKGNVNTSMIQVEHNENLSSGDEVNIKIVDSSLDATLYEGTIKVPNLLPKNPKDIKNLKEVEAKLKEAIEYKRNDFDVAHEKQKMTYFYNTKRGTLAAVYYFKGESGYSDGKEEIYLEVETGQLSIEDNNVLIDNISLTSNDVNVGEDPDSIREALKQGIEKDAHSDYSDFVEIK